MTFGSAVLSFALVAGLVTVIPGLDTALVLRVAVVDGRRYAYATALGICSGALIWGAAAAAGVSVLLTASTLAYTAMRWAGAAYLAYLGATMLRDAWSKRDALVALDQLATRSWRRSYRRGVLTNLLNPKVGVFYVAMLPQFLPAGTPALPMGLLLAFIHDIEARRFTGGIQFTARQPRFPISYMGILGAWIGHSLRPAWASASSSA